MVNPLAHSLKICAAVLAAGVAAAAAEPATPSAESALAAAKRDYASFEQLSGVAEDHDKPGTVRRSLPPLETATEAPPALSPIQRARKAAADEPEQGTGPSKTWLIDAFDALGDTSAPQAMRREGASLEEELEEARTTNTNTAAGDNQRFSFSQRDNLRKRARSTEEIRRDADAVKKPAPGAVRNPLDGYMSKWMTAKDFELLRSKAEPVGQGVSSAFSDVTSSFDFVPAPRAGEGQTIPFESIQGTLGAGFLQGGLTNENPYLEALAPFSPQIPKAAQNETAPLQVMPTLLPQLQQRPPIVDQVTPPPPKPSMSELLKAQDDARHFKQLKRF
jgi:hypothetical protein